MGGGKKQTTGQNRISVSAQFVAKRLTFAVKDAAINTAQTAEQRWMVRQNETYRPRNGVNRENNRQEQYDAILSSQFQFQRKYYTKKL